MSQHPPIQVVNENDEPTGGMPIGDAYAQGLIHRVVYVIVGDENNNILLQKRAPELVTQPNRWDISVAGHVDQGEDYLTTAKREMHEELGLKSQDIIEISTFFKKGLINNKLQRRFVKVFRVTIAHETLIKFDKSEVSAVQWMSVVDIKRLIKEQPTKVGVGLTDCIERFY